MDKLKEVLGLNEDQINYLISNPEIKNLLQEKEWIPPSITKKVKIKTYKRTSKAVTLRYGGKDDVIALYHYLYDGATIYLQRKYDNFQKVLLQ